MILLGINPVFAAPLGGPVALPPSASSNTLSINRIGVVAGVKGNVQINTPGQVGRIVASGEPVHLGDEISTGPEGNLQILLLDETVFTIGPNSAMVIDKFVYDPANQNGEVKAKVVKGLFRFVTGKIARKKPTNMEVELPTGTLGVRGTIVMGEASKTQSTAVLLGPGERTNTGSRIGRFILTSNGNGKTEQTEVTRPGYGASINESGTVSRAFQFPVQEIARMTQALEPVQGPPQQSQNQQPGQQAPPGQGQMPPPGEPRGADQGSPTQQAGQEKAGARGPLGVTGRLGGLFQQFMRESDRAAQQNISAQAGKIFDGPTTRDQLQNEAQKFSGINKFTQTNIPLFNTGGTQIGNYSIQYDINFGNRQVGGGNSRVTGNITGGGLGNFQYDPGTQAFGFGGQGALFNYAAVPNTLSGAGNCPGCVGDVTVGPNNVSGVIAATAGNSLVIKKLGVEQAHGGGNAPRSDGAS